ncbi:MAG: class II aldolase/adducin family protein [Caulobacteraceae bacterium]|nr:class II aldolase/adducin family protein [Caulobacteraceae bacterium]
MSETEEALRGQIVWAMQAMESRGLNRGTSGNVSARFEGGMLITPSGVPAGELTPQSIVFMPTDRPPEDAGLRPSSEWRMHGGLYDARPDCGAVVHCHSRHATILACAGKPIPPLHYMVGVSGKPVVPLAPYATFGSLELAEGVAAAMDGGFSCLMANHGQIAIAPGVRRALAIAEEIEEQAAIYWGTLLIGGPKLLNEDQMAEVFRRFGTYGQKR